MLQIRDVVAQASYNGSSYRLYADALDIAAGQVMALCGISGSGKTMLMEVVGLMRRPETAGTLCLTLPDSGKVVDLGASWSEGPSARMALRTSHIGVVLQDGGLVRWLTVREHLDTVQRATGKIDRAWADRLCEILDLSHKRDARPAQLSMGQRQRAAIARALVHRPALLLIDEPTAPLDRDNSDIAIRLIVDLAKATGAAVLMATHDESLIARHNLPTLRIAPSDDRRSGRVILPDLNGGGQP